MNPLPIVFKEPVFRMRKRSNKDEVFDVLRKKFVRLTPEEKVRQQLIHYLIDELEYPKGLIGIEKGLVVNGKPRRMDMVVYDRGGSAFMILECKAPEVEITQEVFDQAAMYNLKLKVPYLVVSNGSVTYCCFIDWEEKEFVFESEFPKVK